MGLQEQKFSCGCSGDGGIGGDGRGMECGVVVVARRMADCRLLTIVWQSHYFFAKNDSDRF